MSATDTCAVCGHMLALHRVELWGGVAHTVGPSGRRCSRGEVERMHFVGQIDILRTVIRSLRWRAGRLRTTIARWDEEDLMCYSDHWQQRLDRYLAILEEYYPRKERQG